MKIMILNGPKSSGKDFAAEAISQYFGDDCKHVKLSQPLKEIVASILGLPVNKLEGVKEKEIYKGMSYRDMQIFTFQQLSKVFGEDWLGRVTANRLVDAEFPFCVISDGGRPHDVVPLIRAVGPQNILIVQIMREGCTFIGDIRSYISAPNVQTKHIVNKGDATYAKEMIDFAGQFFGDGEE